MTDLENMMDDISYYLPWALLAIVVMITTPVWIIPYIVFKHWLQHEDEDAL